MVTAVTADHTKPMSDSAVVPVDELDRGTRERLGRFELVEVLGQGGMGVVYRGRDEVLSRDVAIKMVRSAGSSELGVRLLREAKAMAKLSHANLVTVYEAGVEDGDVYVAMELVDGQDLADWLCDEHSWDEIVRVFVDAGRGLEAAHAAGIVHRDFKPANVLVAKDATVQVTDFGIALMGEMQDSGDASSSPSDDLRMTQTGVAIGTPSYMSPEQHETRPLDARTDQFSFAVALAEAVYGEPPFTGESRADLAMAVCTEEPTLPERDVPAALRRILRKALRRDRDQRYPSMSELLRELEQIDRPATWRPWAVAGAIAVAAISVVILVLVLGGTDGDGKRSPRSAVTTSRLDAAPVNTASRPDAAAVNNGTSPDAASASAKPALDAAVAKTVVKKQRAAKPRRTVSRKPVAKRPTGPILMTPPRMIGKWRWNNDRCKRYHRSRSCGSCCRHRKRMPYPNCGCYFDFEKFKKGRR